MDSVDSINAIGSNGSVEPVRVLLLTKLIVNILLKVSASAAPLSYLWQDRVALNAPQTPVSRSIHCALARLALPPALEGKRSRGGK